jgi:hypothetical protein
MNKKDLTTKLATTEASLKRWQSRLKRAATRVHELDKQRRRYQLQLLNPDQPVVTIKMRQQKLTSSPVEKSTIDVAEVQRQVDAAIANVTPQKIADVAAAAHEKIPDFLNRAADPLLAEKMTAARKKAEAAARSAMPLSGRAAMAKIRSKK